MKKLKYKIYTLGCKVNQYDSGSLAAKLQAAGFFTGNIKADLAVINTCAVTKTALRKGRQMIARARRENQGAKIVITGCAVKIYKEEVEKWGGDVIILDFRFSILDLIKKISGSSSNQNSKIQNPKSKIGCPSDNSQELYNYGKSRYFIKVQDGCRQFCTYCIIPYARGELKSRPMAEVVAEARAVADAGIKEIVLCGIHLGQFGIDQKAQNTNYPASAGPRQGGGKTQTSLAALLKELIKIKGLERIRLSSIEVNEVTPELISLLKKERKLCRQLHIPLQSGCDKILKLMNRPYTTEMFAEKIRKIRQAMPEIAVTTDVIVGFPGEREKDFQSTVKFIKKINFSQLHVFPFSAHERTPAAALPDQQDEAVKKVRVKKLNDLNGFLGKIYAKRFSGKTLEVIIDGRIRGLACRGRTEYNFDIEFKGKKKYRQGEVVRVKDWQLL